MWSLHNDTQGLTSFILKQGPNGDLGLRGFPGPKGPMGTLVSFIKIETGGTPDLRERVHKLFIAIT